MRIARPGYLDTLRFETNRIADESFAEYYEDIRTVTRDPLWSRRCWPA
jgi:hypothetical protein